MASRSVRVIGGGPAGMFSARLLARDHPDWDITVFERLPPLQTFGFGVGLTQGLLRTLRQADQAVHDDLVGEAHDFSAAWFQLPQGDAELPNSHAGAIGRARLLEVLSTRAQEVGVRVDESSITLAGARRDADLVIAADGVSSIVRAALGTELGASESIGRGQFVWCGAQIELEGTVFVPVTTPDGTFVAHAYPYAPGLATLVIETDDATLSRAGCATDEFAEDGSSDDRALEYLSDAFAELLGGNRLLGNRSRWMRFRTVTCERRAHENVVVLGDAAATAHPSLGSGTKLALEDAASLALALRDADRRPLTECFDEFERTRLPGVRRLQERAGRSQLWWESFPSRLRHLEPDRIAVAYLSRAGAVSLAKVRELSPVLAERAAAEYAGVEPDHDCPSIDAWVLERPIDVGTTRLPSRVVDSDSIRALRMVDVAFDAPDAWSADAGAAVAAVRQALDGAPRVVRLSGGSGRGSLLNRLAFGERLRLELGAQVAVECESELAADAVDGLVAGRADLVVWSTPHPGDRAETLGRLTVA